MLPTSGQLPRIEAFGQVYTTWLAEPIEPALGAVDRLTELKETRR